MQIRDVQAAHDLDARDDSGAEIRGNVGVRREHTVLAEAHPARAVARHALDMNVGNLLLHRIRDHLVDKAD
jgi:hypothetical protein